MQFKPDDIPKIFLKQFPEYTKEYIEFRNSLSNEDKYDYINAGEIASYFLDMIIYGHEKAKDAVNLIDNICKNGNHDTLDVMQIGFFEDIHLMLHIKWGSQGLYLEKRKLLMETLTKPLQERFLNAEKYFKRDKNF
jgi:hypothetical protein